MANLFGHFLKEELYTFARYARHTSIDLAFSGTIRLNTLWFDQQSKEKHQLEENVHNLTLQ